MGVDMKQEAFEAEVIARIDAFLAREGYQAKEVHDFTHNFIFGVLGLGPKPAGAVVSNG